MYKRQGLPRASMVLCEQIRTIDRGRLLHGVGRLTPEAMARVEAALKKSTGL